MAVITAVPALAHETPAPGFNAVLHGPHHGLTADSDEFEQKCEEVREASPELIMPGFDVWVFNIPNGEFDESAASIASIQFDSETINIPPYTDYVIGPAANPHLLAVAVTAGSTLLDGDFSVIFGKNHESEKVVVTHTCPGQPSESQSPTPSESPSPTPSESPSPTPSGTMTPAPSAPATTPPAAPPQEEKPELPVTGLGIGTLLVLGGGLLVGGIAMMSVQRRRDLVSMLQEG